MMRELVLCVVIAIVTASSNIDQNQYTNDEKQIRRCKFSHYLPLISKTNQNDQSRPYEGSSIRMLYPQQSNAFIYNSKLIVPYSMNGVSNVYKDKELEILLFILEKSIKRLVLTKIPQMLIKYFNPKRILRQLFSKELIYRLQNINVKYINEIKKLILKLLHSKGNSMFIKTNKKYETDLIKFTTHKTKEAESYKEKSNSPNLLFNDKFHVLENENKNEQTTNIARSKSVNNIGKNNEDNSKIVIKDVHVNIDDNVSNIANKSTLENKENKGVKNVALMKPSSEINNSTKYTNTFRKKGHVLIEESRHLNKTENNKKIKSLSNQVDNSTFSAKYNTSLNVKDKYNIKHDIEEALDYILPNDGNYVDNKKDIHTTKYPEFIKKGADQESIFKYNIRKNLGYHNLHQISQGKSLETTEYYNDHINKNQAPENISEKIQNKEYQFIGTDNHTSLVQNSQKTDKQRTRDTVTQNLLTKHTSTTDQNKKLLYVKPLEFEIEDLSTSGMPYYSQEIFGAGKSNKKDTDNSSNNMNKSKLHSGVGNTQKKVHTHKNKEDEKILKVENINENNIHKIVNLQGIESNFRNSLKPIEITKSHKVIVKETKTITFDDQSELNKNKKTKLSPENLYELFLLKDNFNQPHVNKIIETDYETSDQIKINNNNDKNNIHYITLNNIFLSNNKNGKNDKRCIKKNKTFVKPVKDQLDLPHGKGPSLAFKKVYNRYKIKNNVCSDCKQEKEEQEEDNTQKMKNLNVGLFSKGTILNENVKIDGKTIQNKNQSRKQTVRKTSYRNKNYRNDGAFTDYKDIKTESTHVMKKRNEERKQGNTDEASRAMTNKDKVIANILAPEDVKNDKKLLPYWLPSDAQDVYEILQQPSKEGAVNENLDLEAQLKEEIDKLVQIKKEFGNENLEEIINLKINTVGIGKPTNINNKLIPSLYDVYLKNFITKILYRLSQKLLTYEYKQKENKTKNLDIHEIRQINSVLDIFESVREVYNKQDDEFLHDLLVSLLRFNKNSEEDFDEEVKVILDSVSRRNIYGVIRHFLVPEPTINAVRDYLKQQELYSQFVYFKVLENILPNIKIIIINALAIKDDDHDDINKNVETMDKLVKILITLYKVLKDLGIPETTQRFIIEESVLDIVKNLGNAYIKKYEETIFVQFKKQLQEALYNNIDV